MVEDTPQDRLHKGLSKARIAVNDSTVARAWLRPSKAVRRLDEALARVREGLLVATEAVGDLLRSYDRGDGMDRRGLLRALSTAATTALLPPAALDRLVEVAQAVGGSRRVDAALLDRLEDVTSSLAQRYYTARPDELTGAVRGLADTITRLLDDGSMDPGHRERLATIAADTHLFAGWLALDSDLRADARAYFRMARDLAQEADDGVLHALALHSDGVLYGLRTPDGRCADPQHAVWRLSQALGGLPAEAPQAVRAYMTASLASHRSKAGDVYGFSADMVRAADAVEWSRLGHDAPRSGFASAAGWLSVIADDNYLDEYEGRGLATLRRRRAPEVLERALKLGGNSRRRTTAYISLAGAQAAHEPDQAAAWAIRAFDTALLSGYVVAYPALDVVRAKLPGDVPGVAELDERLATV